MTGEKLFFLYAFPCADIRYVSGKIENNQLTKLMEVNEGKREVKRKLLKWCFPNAFRSVREHAKIFNLEEWSFENISQYWRIGHGHVGDCRVLLITVVRIDRIGRMFVTFEDGVEKLALNPYRYSFSIGDRYYMHQRCLIEKK